MLRFALMVTMATPEASPSVWNVMSDKSAGKGKSNGWLLPAIVVAVAVCLLAIFTLPMSKPDQGASGQGQQATNAAGSEEGQPPADVDEPPDLTFVERRDPVDPLTAGDVKAPVGLVVFSDYQCPYCAAWSSDTLPKMMEYAENGDLYIEWRDLNIFGDESERASRAAYAAGLQGKFWEYHKALFHDGKIRSAGELSEEALVALAQELGLGVEKFTADMASGEVESQVRANQRLGIDLGVYSTPAFVVGGKAVMGAQPTQVFIDAVDAALADTQG